MKTNTGFKMSRVLLIQNPRVRALAWHVLVRWLYDV